MSYLGNNNARVLFNTYSIHCYHTHETSCTYISRWQLSQSPFRTRVRMWHYTYIHTCTYQRIMIIQLFVSLYSSVVIVVVVTEYCLNTDWLTVWLTDSTFASLRFVLFFSVQFSFVWFLLLFYANKSSKLIRRGYYVDPYTFTHKHTLCICKHEYLSSFIHS